MPITIKNSKGFSIVEVMVAVLVLAIGILGIAGLQLTGVKNNHSAYLRSQATLFAYDMIDRARANPVAYAAGLYNRPASAIDANCATTTGCTPAAMAGNDMYEWTSAAYNGSISTILPSGQTIICLDSTFNDGASAALHACDGLGSVYAVKIWWADDKNGALKRFVTTAVIQ